MSEASDHIEAIDRYIRRTAVVTPAAGKLKGDWVKWYDGLNFITKSLDSNAQQASNRRNAFNIANVKNEAELANVKEVIATGATREELLGKPRIADKAGNYPKQPGTTVASAAKGTVLTGARPTIRQGSKGDAVKAWQKIIAVTADGNFGPQTKAATIRWQSDRGLVADGVVGSATWNAALGGVNAPPMSPAVAAVTPVAPAGINGSAIPTGSVASAISLAVPRPTIAKAEPKPPSKIIAATQKPVTESADPTINPSLAGMIPTVKSTSLIQKVALGVIAAVTVVGAAVAGAAVVKR